MRGCVDAVDRPPNAHGPSVADLDADGAVRAVRHSEAELHGRGLRSVVGALLVVEVEEADKVGEDLTAVVLPVEPAPDQAPRCEPVALLLPDGEQVGPPRFGPARPGRGHGAFGDGLGQPALEDPVHETAALQGADAMLVVGVVDGLDPQDVAHEVGVRAPGPHLQPGGGGRLAAAGRVRQGGPPEVASRQVAVEAGEPWRHAGPAQLDAPADLGALAHAGESGQVAPGVVAAGAGVVPVEHAPGVVLLGVGREPGATQPGHERRHLLGFACLLGQPPARRPVRGAAEIAAGVK